MLLRTPGPVKEKGSRNGNGGGGGFWSRTALMSAVLVTAMGVWWQKNGPERHVPL
jgi:hypothetical protein